MRILVSCIPYDKGKSGISVYVREVVRSLAAQGHELTLLCEPDENGLNPPDAGQETLSSLSSHVSCPMVHAPRWTRRPALSMLWHLLFLPFWIRRRRGEFDGFVICAANRRVCAWYPVPTVATVHDLANFHIPGKYSRLRMFYLAHVLPHFAKKAHHLVAVSGATKADMVKFWHCRKEDVTVLYNGLQCGRETRDARRGEHSRLTADVSCRGMSRSILYISRIEHPGKNHVRLIEAYGKLPRTLAEAHPLVIVGSDWKDAEVVHAAAAASPYSDLIRFSGFADGEALERLWAEAGFYVFPSLFEGFGLSLVEAMAKGVPCACSNNGSLGEIAGDVAITFDPYDVDAIAAAIKRLLEESPELRAERIARGLEHVKKFSWPDHAKGIVAELGKSEVFGVHIDCETNAEAVALIRAGGGRMYAFVNAHCLNIAYNDHEYRDILNNVFDKVWPDGVGVRMAGRRLGFSVPENVNGTDLFPLIASSGGLSFWFLGGRPGVAVKAMERCMKMFPTSRFLGATDGYQSDWSRVLPDIAAARPDVLLVALGVPMQEKWLATHGKHLRDIGCAIAVGGLLDFLSGRIPRAPRWVRKLSIEWMWRLAMEPRRMFVRYVIGNFMFMHRISNAAKEESE